MKYLVTKEIKSDVQVVWKLYFQDLVFLLLWITANWYFKDAVHQYLQMPFVIFAIIIGVVLVLPSTTNPNRRQYQSISLYLTRPQETLYYIKKEEEKNGEEQDRGHKKRYPRRKI